MATGPLLRFDLRPFASRMLYTVRGYGIGAFLIALTFRPTQPAYRLLKTALPYVTTHTPRLS